MRLKNILIVVKDIEVSKQFYQEVFGLRVVRDGTDNVILTDGLVLQRQEVWESFLEKTVIHGNHACELYFEEREIEAFAEKLEKLTPAVAYVNQMITHEGGKKVLRFYDPDGHLIEVGTPG